MARILYAVAGDGLGHATRAHSVGAGLLDRGHDVLFISSMRGTAYLREHFPDRVEDIFGLHIHYRQGQALAIRTVVDNAWAAARRLPGTLGLIRDIMRRYRPDLLITDFEAFTAHMAGLLGLRWISLDNQHLLTHCDVEQPPGYWRDYLSTYITIRFYYAGARRYLITSFIDAPVHYAPATLLPPVLRPAVYRQESTVGSYLVAYAGACGSINQVRAALETYRGMDIRAYGFGITGQQGQVVYKPTSEREFLADLAGCAGVIATAGHSLVGECLHFAKPMLLMPIAHQYEQIVNAYHVQKMGAGRHVERLEAETISDFTQGLDRHRHAMDQRTPADLGQVLDAIEAELP